MLHGMMPESGRDAHLAAAIERDGYAVVQDFLAATDVAALAAECRALHDRGELHFAAVGRGTARAFDANVRGDRTRWFHADDASTAQRRYRERFEALRETLNRALLLGLDDFEAHYALYAPGARYARHRDRFRDDDARVLSSVLYLNDNWNAADGGALRLYLDVNPAGPFRDIVPNAGTLVLFLSADFEHEVLPATRDRISIAGWFRRSSLPR
jgi:SM-20-related protein